jgi:hypothetical protein
MKAFVRLSLMAVALGLFTAQANAVVLINEVLASTAGTDAEFIELYNTGPAAVDIGDWFIELWDSDSGAQFGLSDGAAPYFIPTGTMLASGGYYLFYSPQADIDFGLGGAPNLPANAIENSSFTMILKDAAFATVNSIFMWDSGALDAANDAGTLIVPDATVGPDGAFLPAGFYRAGDGSSNYQFLEFDRPFPSATPGGMNLPEPGTLVLLAMGGVALLRRRS